MMCGEATSFERVGSQMQEWLQATFGGILQTIINENANRELRDGELRRGTSKSMSKMEKWAIPCDSGLMAKFHRTEISPNSAIPVPQHFGADALFQPIHDSTGNGDSVDLKRICGKQHWHTYNTTSVGIAYVEMEMLAWARRHGKWGYFDTAWLANFIPEAHFILRKSTKEPFFVLRVMVGAVIGCAVSKRFVDTCKYAFLKMGDTQLVFLAVETLDDWRVMEHKVLSPLDMHLLRKGFHEGFTAEFLGKQIGVMDFQSRRGFPGVPESALKKMAELKGSEELHLGETSGCKYDDHLALKLMLAMEPQLSMAEARTMLLTRNLEDDLDASGYIDDVEDEYWNDVVLLGDQKSSKGVLKAMREAKERRAQVKISTQRLVTTCFEARATAKKKPKAAAKKEAAQRKQENARLYADLSEDVHSALTARLPGPASVVTDRLNGRWICSYPNMKNKSASWTHRGETAAAELVLRTVWGWHRSATGAEWPSYLADGGADSQAPTS